MSYEPNGENYTVITEYEAARELLTKLQNNPHPWRSLDTETTGLCPHRNRIRLLQFGVQEGERVHSYLVDAAYVTPRLFKPLLERTDIFFIGHNLSFDLKMLLEYDIKTTSVWDTMIAAKVNEAGWDHMVGKHSLADVALRTLGLELNKDEQKSNWAAELCQDQITYAAEDVQPLHRIKNVLMNHAVPRGLAHVITLEMQMVPVVAWWEYQGISLDEAAVKRLMVKYAEQLEREEAAVHAIMGLRTVTRTKKERIPKAEREIIAQARKCAVKDVPQWRSYTAEERENWNLDSPAQLKEWLKANNIPVPLVFKQGKKVESLDADALHQMDHPFAEVLLAYRKTAKLYGTYLKPALDWINPITGKVHSSFNQLVSSGSRTASSDPNVMNIPRESDLRSIFVPDPGKLMLLADYTQIELVLIAGLSGDEVMCRDFREGRDLHGAATDEVHGLRSIPKSDPRRKAWEAGEMFEGITPYTTWDAMRSDTKPFVFGNWYGAGPNALSKQTGRKLSIEQCKVIQDKLRARHPQIVEYFKQVTRESIEQGYSTTMLGRRRYYYKPKDDKQAAAVSREANNHRIQGSAFDMWKAGAVEAYRAGIDLRIPCHDENVAVVDPEQAEQHRALLGECMIRGAQKVIEASILPFDVSVPIKADAKIGTSWADKK